MFMDNPKNILSIPNLSEEDRPREKLLEKGLASLTNAELIAILIGSGSSEMNAVDLSKLILKKVNHNLSELSKLSIRDLQKFKGIGQAKAISIVSALELGRRKGYSKGFVKEKFTNSLDIYEYMMPKLLDLYHEEFWVVLLNRSNVVLKCLQISTGGLSGTVVDPKIIFKAAVSYSAASIVLVHNHPSGNITPSLEDIKLTKKLKEGGKLLEIQVIDHIIFGNEGYYSFSDQGFM